MSLTPMGKERRLIKRHQLNDCLTVYNRNTLREMGSIGNITCNGLMLISSVPVLIGAIYNMRIIMPGENDRTKSLIMDFDVRCHWCKPDVGAGIYDSGYSIVNAGHGIVDLVDALKEYFSFSEVE